VSSAGANGPAPQAALLVGRSRERSAIDALLDDARAGNGRALLLHGEAGVGKSVLLDYAREAADGLRVLGALGVEPESELPFSALADLLRGGEAAIEELPASQLAALRSALGLEPTSAADRFAIYAATRNALAAIARDGPLLVTVDDVHWLDAASREAIVFAAKRLDDEPVAILFAARDGEGAAMTGLGLEELALEGLSAVESEELVARTAPETTKNVRGNLHAGTGGNPLALVELVRDLDPAQLVGREPLPEPLPIGKRLEQVFGVRVRELPDHSRRALLVAAASESGAMDVVLDAMEGLDIPRDALAPAESAGLVTVTEGRLAWRHPLVRSASYHGATGPERRATHLALAEVARAARLEDNSAWHLAAAAEVPDEDVARALEDVAERARARGGLAGAMRALATAARLTPDDEKCAGRGLAAAEVAVALGESEEAVRLVAHSLERTADIRLRAHGERLRARVDILRGVPSVGHERLVSTAEAIAAAEPALAVELLCEAIVANMADGNSPVFRATAERAIEVAAHAGPGADALPGLMLSLEMLASGEGEPAVELFDRHRHVAESPELWAAAPEIAGITAFCLTWLERFDEAERLLTRLTTWARDSGAVRALAFPLAVLGDVQFRRGQWPAARASMLEAVQLSEYVGEVVLLANNLAYLARIEAWLGREEETRSHAARALEISEGLRLGAVSPYAWHALGALELSLGEPERAITQLENVGRLQTFWGEPGHILWEPDLIEAYIRAGRDSDAAKALARYGRVVDRTGRCHGRAVLARLNGLRAPVGEFDEHFETALQWHDRAGMPFARARTALYYGERLRRARRRAEARRHLGDAAAAFERLGAKPWVDRARREQAAAGERLSADAAAPTWSDLTDAEARVAKTILSGATYQEAANSLYLSPRTVEFHLRQIYRKLGVRSRSELAARLGINA
jgi:DNA-binding CsgD family transcriptional regulator